MDRKRRILVCDDDAVYLTAVKRFLTRDTNYEVKTLLTGEETMVELKSSKWDLVLLDVNLYRPNAGFDFITKFRDIDPQVAIVMLSGEKDFQVVRKALQLGALDYFPKDGSPEELVFSIERVLEGAKVKKQVRQKDAELSRVQKRLTIIGQSPAMQTLQSMVEKARRSNFNVLITGETGVGKEVVARQLRRENEDGGWLPFVPVDSSTILGTTAESQLFGHEKGAFTGADKQRSGLFEDADGGIIYFDEIENMPLDIQAKLLRAIQEKEITRLGGSQIIDLEFRVIAATNKNIPELVKEGKFREDLYQRMNVIPLRVPSLRERLEDIPLLLEYFADKHSVGDHVLEFSEEAFAALQNYSWPGNVRELGNMVAYLTAMKDDPYVHVEDLPIEVRSPARSLTRISNSSDLELDANYHRRMAHYEKAILLEEYQQAAGNISKMATKLGLDRSTLYSKLAMHGIHKASSRSKELAIAE